MYRQAPIVIVMTVAALTLACSGVALPTEAVPEPVPAHAETVDGRYRLVFDLASANWQPGQPIEGRATLHLLAGGVADFSGSGGGPFGFEYVEVGGRRRIDPIWTADCAQHQLRADAPLVTELTKSGAFGGGGPDDQFYRQFLTDPEVKLPFGVWDITAIASFIDGRGCDGRAVEMRATIRIVVSD